MDILSGYHGALAHLARALRWQRRGDQFESGMLHHIFWCNSARYTLSLSYHHGYGSVGCFGCNKYTLNQLT